VDVSSSKTVCSQQDPAIWLNVKEEPADEDSHTTKFDTNVQQPIEPKEDIQIQVGVDFRRNVRQRGIHP